jgi:hypothetical protein
MPIFDPYNAETETGDSASEMAPNQELTLDELIDQMAKLKLAEKAVSGLTEYQRQALERIAELQAKRANGEELTSPETIQLELLTETARTGEPPASIVKTNDLLLKRIGPEAFKRVQKRRAQLEADTAALKASNDEMQRQLELISKTENMPVPNQPLFNGNSLRSRVSTPGTYVVEVAEGGVVTEAYAITPKQVAAMTAKPSLWARFINLFRKTS